MVRDQRYPCHRTVRFPLTSFNTRRDFQAYRNNQKKLKKKRQKRAVLYDFEKAFDTTPHHFIIKNLKLLKCPINIAKYANDYLKERTFQINLNSQLHHYDQLQQAFHGAR